MNDGNSQRKLFQEFLYYESNKILWAQFYWRNATLMNKILLNTMILCTEIIHSTAALLIGVCLWKWFNNVLIVYVI